MQTRHARNRNVRIKMFMLLAVDPVANRFGSTFEMNRKAVAAHAGIERLVAEVQVESKLVAVIRNCSVEIVHQKLRRDSKDLRCTGHCLCDHHIDPPSSSLHQSAQRQRSPAPARASGAPPCWASDD